jgi:xylitol oxidase
MKRQTFIRLGASIAGSTFVNPFYSWAQQPRLQNWAKNVTYSTANVWFPKSVTEAQQLIKNHSRIRSLGTRHCFNTIADSKDGLISSRDLNKVISLNKEDKTVTVEGGIKYGELAPYLHQHGFALPNLASLPHISVAGSISTATHGSGIKNGNLATSVSGLEFILADGSIARFSNAHDAAELSSVVVGLGAIGFITKVTLDVIPTFNVRQRVFTRMPIAEVKTNFLKIMSAGYSVSLFTDWQSDYISEVWIKSVVGSAKDQTEPEFYGAKAAVRNLHPVIAQSAEKCTDQMGVSGVWYERLPHFKMGFTPSTGKELQSEFFIPIQHAVEAISAISSLGKQIGPHLFITEIRTIAEDKLWLSPCYKQTSVTIHFTWKQETSAVMKLLPLIEKELAPFNVRPHWGKLFTIAPKVLASRYEKFEDFKTLLTTYDPKKKFCNAFLNKNLYGLI